VVEKIFVRANNYFAPCSFLFEPLPCVL